VNTTLTLKNKITYGVGAVGMDMSYGLCFSFFMKYCTDVLLVSSVFLGVMIALARVWDGISDPMGGTIFNNTKSRYGRFRPWMLIGGVTNAAVLFFMFFNPGFTVGGGRNIGLYAYITAMYVLWGLTMTSLDIPFWSFIPTLTSDLNERNVVSAIARFFSGLGQLTVMGATPLVLSKFAADRQGEGFTLIAACLGGMVIITTLVTVLTTRERITPKKPEKISFRETVKVLRGNDQLLVFLAVIILFNMGWYLMNSLAAYFFDYVIDVPGKDTYFTLFAAVSGIAQAAGLALMSPLARRFGKQRVFKGGIIAAIAGYCALLFVSTRGSVIMPLFFVFDAIACLGIGCVFTAQMSMFADLVDYGEFRLGKRTESIVYSMKSFQMKFAQMIQALIVGLGLALFGYQKNVYPQPASGKTGIVLMMFLIPPVLAIFSYVLFARKYKLHSEYLEEVAAAVR